MLAVRWHASGDESLTWDCEECQEKQLDRARNCAFLDLPREEWNEAAAWDFDPSLRQCPKSLVTKAAWDIREWWLQFRMVGALPFPGAIGDQPNWIVEAFTAAEEGQRSVEAARESEQLVQIVNRGKESR